MAVSTPAASPPPTASDFDPHAPLPPEMWPNIDHLITEDDAPMDNIFSEKQQRLLTRSLYSSWSGPGEGRSFLALANVGLFYAIHAPPLVPDVLVSLDVQMPDDIWSKQNRSYLIWEYGKPPNVVIEIVSNQKGNEDGSKLEQYARLGITYYAIFDPLTLLSNAMLRIYALQMGTYVETQDRWLAGVEIGLTLWDGRFEDSGGRWLRWCDRDGHLLLTGQERAEQERQRAEQERERAEQEHQRAERLAAQLRALGVDPEA